MKDCIFCKIIDGEIPSMKVFEDDKVVVIMDINPAADGHVLVIPKKHYTDFTELDINIIEHIKKISENMINLIYEKLGANGVRLVVNYGNLQEVKHFHLHLIPSYTNNETIDNVIDIFNRLT